MIVYSEALYFVICYNRNVNLLLLLSGKTESLTEVISPLFTLTPLSRLTVLIFDEKGKLEM